MSSFNHFLNNEYAVVADIGGTNARFSRVNLSNMVLDKTVIYSCARFTSLSSAFIHYRRDQGLMAINCVAVAIACPVIRDKVSMTNCNWQFSIKALKRQLNLSHLVVLNDFAAAAMSLQVLADEEMIQIGGDKIQPQHPKVLLGAGTGLGTAFLIPVGGRFSPVASEAGHTDWKAETGQEKFIQRFLAKRFGHVSAERVLSGPGLECLYLALAAYENKSVNPLSASDIAKLALLDQSTLARAAVMQFFSSFGSMAGDLALTLNALGGVYIAGGIVPKLLPLIHASDFRSRFEDKGRFREFNSKIPCFVVNSAHPGLIGAALYLKQLMDNENGFSRLAITA